MSEYVIGWTAVGSLAGLTGACALYMLGGRHGKWQRRYLGSFVLSATVNAASCVMGLWTAWLLLVFPCLVAGFSLGYGGDTLLQRVFRRLVYVLGVCSAGLVFYLVLGHRVWWIFWPHLGMGLWSVYLGTKNPVHAAAEETFICAMLNIGLCMYPFVPMVGR